MPFNSIDPAIRRQLRANLQHHLSIAGDILTRERRLLPMLLIRTQAGNQLIGLQPAHGQADADKAYAAALARLKAADFDSAVFSYSTRIALEHGKETEALKNVLFASGGAAAVAFVPYRITGLLKRRIVWGQPILSETFENVFDA